MKGQTKHMSVLESLLNVAIGYGVALATQLLVFPLFGIHISLSQNIGIGVIFTAVSIVRSYIVRRFFNWLYLKLGI